MARPGISKQEVFKAANQLVSLGKDPTIEQIRQILKTGSNSTIAGHLRDWRASQSDTQTLALTEGLPHDMVTIMKGLWVRLAAEANLKTEEVVAKYEQKIAVLEQELQKYKTNNQRWQHLMTQWQQEKEKLMADRLTFEQNVESLQNDKIALQAKLEADAKHLDEKQARVEELQRIHSQAQTNLEHYRDTTREQRVVEQQQFEQQKQRLETEIKALNTQMRAVRDQSASIQQQHIVLLKSYEALQTNHALTVSKLENVQEKIAKTEALGVEHQQASKHWEAQYTASQMQLQDKTYVATECQIELKLLSQQLSTCQKTIQNLQDQNKLLSHEKWEISAEKSQLEGQLKQMQKMIRSEEVA